MRDPADNVQCMVRPARLERATHGLEGRCSIQLSYGRLKNYVWDFIKRRRACQ